MTTSEHAGQQSVLGKASRLKDGLLAAALVAAVFLAYQPAWHGGFVWDDDMHVTKPALQSLDGLHSIWFRMGATLQYYPLLHSVFWLEHKLWGDSPLGYHLVNIAMHALAALMAAVVLRRLQIPGAYLAAAIFALHPIQVESVAWITELKNTLSTVLYLGAAITYLCFDQSRKTQTYLAALGLFVLSVLSKTVTATLPGALLVIFWWQRGRLSWKNDVLPLAPFLVLGAGGGMITAWWELKLNNCVGPEFTFTAAERFLMAGHAVWFHLGKLFWPTQLTFIYPRWPVDAGAWRQYLFPLGAMALLAALWAIRHRTRAPLAALLFFGGTLFPTLGFFNLYTFRYSLVANHYQYLACLGIFTLVSAGAALLLRRWRRAGCVLAVVLLAVLASLTWRQSRTFANAETLYQATIAENPACWMAHNNLGVALAARGQLDRAIAEYRKALESRPNYAEARNNLGADLAAQGRFDEAIAEYRKALQIKPDYVEAHYNFGIALAARGQLDEAIAEYRKALESRPNYAEARNNLGADLAAQGRFDEAIAEYRKALQIKPDYVEAHYNFGIALAARGQLDEAIAEYRKALELKPDLAAAHNSLGTALYEQRRFPEAAMQWREAVRLESSLVHLNCLAWLLATCPEGSIRNGAEAVDLAQRAVRLSGEHDPNILDTLAAAYAEAGRFPEAVQCAERARDLAAAQGKTALAESLRARIRHYQSDSPYRDKR